MPYVCVCPVCLVSGLPTIVPRYALYVCVSGVSRVRSSHHCPTMSPLIYIGPGEVNRIMSWAKNGNIVVTHSDSPNLYCWNMMKQVRLHPSQ